MSDTKERSITDTDATHGDLDQPNGLGYAYWAGRLSVAVEFALRGQPGEKQVASEALAAYRAAVAKAAA